MKSRNISPPLILVFTPALVVFFIPWPLHIQAALTLIGCGVAIGALVLALTFCITPIKSLYLSLHKT